MTIKKKVSVWFVSLKVLEATFCVGVKTKRPTRNTVCIRETPVKLCGVCPRRQKILGTALNAGVPDRLFKRHGSWASESAKDEYVQDSLSSRLSVSKALCI